MLAKQAQYLTVFSFSSNAAKGCDTLGIECQRDPGPVQMRLRHVGEAREVRHDRPCQREEKRDLR